MDGKSAVIHILAEYAHSHAPALLLSDSPDTRAIREASLASLPALREELRERRQHLQFIDFSLQQYQPVVPEDLLVKRGVPFVAKTRAELDTVQTQLEGACESYLKLCVLFYIDAGTKEPELNPFSLLHQFLLDLQRAAQENRAKKAEEEQRAAREQRAMANTVRSQASRIRAILEGADDKDRNMVDGLLVALR
jgi:hypothetical protein